jgi:uncharacterized membrane protein YeaQ/YmgE (transglycosylase-associated protein family)
MTIMDFVLLLAVAGLIGLLGQVIAGYSLGGCLVSIVVGFIGAVVGLWLARNLGLPEFFTVEVGGKTFPVIWSVIGSALLVFAVRLFTARRVLV